LSERHTFSYRKKEVPLKVHFEEKGNNTYIKPEVLLCPKHPKEKIMPRADFNKIV